ncbi:MAG: hypothetical protein AAF944_08070 [Bacteroidota bacterium]
MAKTSARSSVQLIEKFQQFEPGLQTVYVGTVLKNALTTNNNQYLNLVYQNFATEGVKVIKVLKDNYWEVVARKLKGERVVVHYHWFQYSSHKFLRPVTLNLFWLAIFRLLGGKLVWTVHNRNPHIRKYTKLNHLLRIIFEKLSYRNHVHCYCAVEEMSAILKAKTRKFFVVPHPNYPVQLRSRGKSFAVLKEKYHQMPNMRELQPKDEVYLMFGQIRQYKGILPIAEIFASFPERKTKKLIIAGSSKEATYVYKLEQLPQQHTNIILVPHFIPDEDEGYFYGAADKVILNHTEILTSGAAILAINYGKKLMVPDICCLSELEGAQIFANQEELTRQIFG